jgi:hypothetical protein
MRFFISYHRGAADDQGLARFFRDRLQTAGHDVFIDVGMRVGTDWVAEIARRIEWCDHLIVLLSAASIHSEMLLGEVRLAHRQRRRDGRPAILPIRVHYDGPLDYELDSYIGRIQYTRWNAPKDSERVLDDLLQAAGDTWPRGLAGAPAPSYIERPHESDPRRPHPGVDARALKAPGGTIRIDDSFYIERQSDRLLASVAPSVGETIVIKAPRQMGKSSLLIRYLAECQKVGKRFAYLDFQHFTDAELAEYRTLLGPVRA